MWIVLSAFLAHAARQPPPTPILTGPRTVKIDLFALEPGIHQWGRDWKVTMLEQWSAILACQPAGERTESCSFVDGVWWGAVVEGSDQLVLIKLPAPGTLEITWTPRGRIASWDVLGDRSAFRSRASNTMLQLTFHRQDMAFKRGEQQAIGERIEQSLVRQLVGALEWELPKKHTPEVKPWSPSQAPWMVRRWLESTLSHQIELSVTEQTEAVYQISMTGRLAERYVEGSLGDAAVQTTVEGQATFDRAVGGVTRAQVETLTSTSSGPPLGHARALIVVTPWQEGDPVEPGDMPSPQL